MSHKKVSFKDIMVAHDAVGTLVVSQVALANKLKRAYMWGKEKLVLVLKKN